MSYSNNYLDKLFHLVTVEQLSNILRETNSKTMDDKMNTTSDILSFPIVQKIIHSYENELKESKQADKKSCGCACLCNEEKNILRHNEIISNFNEIKRQIFSLQTQIDTMNYSKEKLESVSSNEKGQTKLTQFSNFTSKEKLIPVKEEHIVLKIEEKDLKNADECEEVFIDNIEKNIVHEICEDSEEEEQEEEDVEEEEDKEEEEQGDDEEEDVEEEEEEEEQEVEEEDKEESESDSESEEEVGYDDEEEEQEKKEEEIIKEKEEQEEKVEEDDEEVFEIEIDDVTYFATDEENGILYEADENGEVGKKVGIIKNGEPQFLS